MYLHTTILFQCVLCLDISCVCRYNTYLRTSRCRHLPTYVCRYDEKGPWKGPEVKKALDGLVLVPGHPALGRMGVSSFRAPVGSTGSPRRLHDTPPVGGKSEVGLPLGFRPKVCRDLGLVQSI